MVHGFQQQERSNKRCAYACNLHRMHCFALSCGDVQIHSIKSMVKIAARVGVVVYLCRKGGRVCSVRPSQDVPSKDVER